MRLLSRYWQKLQFSEGLTEAQESASRMALTQLLAGGSSFLPCEPMHSFLECPDDMIAGSCPEKTERKRERNTP